MVEIMAAAKINMEAAAAGKIPDRRGASGRRFRRLRRSWMILEAVGSTGMILIFKTTIKDVKNGSYCCYVRCAT